MKNIFKGNSQKKVPKTLNECIKPDGVSMNLWSWAERLEKWGSVLFKLIIVYGIINTIYSCVTAYQETVIWGEEDIAILAVFFAILKGSFIYTLYAFLEYCAYHAIALLLGALASIVQNTNISANLALYSTKAKSGDKFIDEPDENEIEPETEDVTCDPRTDINVLNIPIKKKDIKIIEENYIDTKCPQCGEVLSFPESAKNVTCPWCNKEFNI